MELQDFGWNKRKSTTFLFVYAQSRRACFCPMYTLSRVPTRHTLLSKSDFVCPSCRYQLRRLWQPPTGKDQRSKYAAKVRQAEQEWGQKAEEIRAGRQQGMLEILEERGFVNAIAGDRKELSDLMTDKRIGIYVGVDPTAPSMHLGHLLPMMALFWMYIHGFTAVTILGGATAKIGDPSGRTKDRDMPASATRKANMANMHIQISEVWKNMEVHALQKHGYKKDWAWTRSHVNNNNWLNQLNIIEFLRTVGHATRIGPMLGRDTVKTKLDSGAGLSFAELTYPLLQAWDWWSVLKMQGVQLQIGGSDQYGNLIAGMEVVNHMQKNHNAGLPPVIAEMKPFGLTTPLLTTARGEKFGKSAGNAIWLDKEMTSPFDLYQFFLRSADADVARYLKLFTLIPIPEIESLVTEHMQDPGKRVAQRRLAREVVSMLHGDHTCKQVEYQAGVLLKAPSEPKTPDVKSRFPDYHNPELNPRAPQVNSTNAPSHNIVLPRSLVENQPFSRVLYSAGMVASRSEGHRMVTQGGAHVGSRPSHKGGMPDALKYTRIQNWDPSDTWHYVMDDSLMILRIGKWKVKIVKIIPDAAFDADRLDAPGWKEFKEGRSNRREAASSAESIPAE